MAMRSAPRVVLAFALTLGACTDSYLVRGDKALSSGEYQEAVAFYELAIEHMEPDEDRRKLVARLASAHRVLGTSLAQKSNCGDARSHVAAAEEHSSPVLTDHDQLVDCERRQNAPTTVRIAGLERFIEVGDSQAKTLRILMALHLELKQQDKALGYARRLEARSDLVVPDRQELGFALAQMGRTEEAYSQLKQALAKEPNQPLVRLKLAELMEARGETADARQHYSYLAQNYPRNRLIQLRLAAFHRRCGEPDAARQAEELARRLGIEVPTRRSLRTLPKSKQ